MRENKDRFIANALVAVPGLATLALYCWIPLFGIEATPFFLGFLYWRFKIFPKLKLEGILYGVVSMTTGFFSGGILGFGLAFMADSLGYGMGHGAGVVVIFIGALSGVVVGTLLGCHRFWKLVHIEEHKNA